MKNISKTMRTLAVAPLPHHTSPIIKEHCCKLNQNLNQKLYLFPSFTTASPFAPTIPTTSLACAQLLVDV